MIVRLAHVCFITRKFNEMTAFYRDILGLPVQFYFHLPGGTVYGMYFAFGETTFLELFDEEGAAESLGKNPTDRKVVPESTYQHFCLQVDGLESMRNRLISQGIDVTEIKPGKSGSLMCWIKDPDGNDIELMEYTGESLQLKPPE